MKKKLEVMMTSVNVGRKEVSMKVSAELLGIKSKDPVVQKFIEEHIDSKVYFIPKKIEKELNTIETRLRTAHAKNSVKYLWGKDDKLTFMTKEMAERFEKEYLQKCKKEYFDKLEEILKDYKTIKDEFFKSFEAFLSTNKKKDKFMREMKSIIPIEVDYASTFYMSFNCKKMDITEDQDVINSFLAESIQIIYNGAVAFEKSFSRNKKIASRTLGIANNIKEKVNELNISENEEVFEILKYFDKIIGYGGKGLYVDKAIKSMKEDCRKVANYLGIYHLITF